MSSYGYLHLHTSIILIKNHHVLIEMGEYGHYREVRKLLNLKVLDKYFDRGEPTQLCELRGF